MAPVAIMACDFDRGDLSWRQRPLERHLRKVLRAGRYHSPVEQLGNRKLSDRRHECEGNEKEQARRGGKRHGIREDIKPKG